MLKEKIKERQVLRNKVLSSLYDYYFDNDGATYRTTKDELINAKEEKLAYDYLVDKGFITVDRMGNQYLNYRITSYGIDEFERIFLSE